MILLFPLGLHSLSVRQVDLFRHNVYDVLAVYFFSFIFRMFCKSYFVPLLQPY